MYKEEFSPMKFLSEHNINSSIQRVKILEYLYNNRTHPAIDTIFDDMYKELPTLSKTTIYNTLREFKKKGIVLELPLSKNECHYDINTEAHAHFVCNKCGAIYDIKTNCENLEGQYINEHKIQEQIVFYKGICKKCLKNFKK